MKLILLFLSFQDIVEFLNQNYRGLNVTRKLARDTLALNISLTPDELLNLAKGINETVQNLTNVDKILNDAQADYLNANYLRDQALVAK